MSSLSDFIGAGGAKVWVSGSTVKQWQYVISPLDGELYQRITATGAGTTDPADDITNYAARSYERCTSLPNPSSYITQAGAGAANFANGAVKVAPATITVGTRTELLSVTGRGVVKHLGFMKGISGGGRLEIRVDDRVVFDQNIQSISTDASILIGSCSPGGASMGYPAFFALQESGVAFLRSFVVHYTPAGSNTNTNTVLSHIIRGVA